MSERKKNLLLHICCAPCSTHVVEQLKADYDLAGYFYNPNIHPESEYLRRENEMKRYAGIINLDLVCDEYDSAKWFELTKGMDGIPERRQAQSGLVPMRRLPGVHFPAARRGACP